MGSGRASSRELSAGASSPNTTSTAHSAAHTIAPTRTSRGLHDESDQQRAQRVRREVARVLQAEHSRARRLGHVLGHEHRQDRREQPEAEPDQHRRHDRDGRRRQCRERDQSGEGCHERRHQHGATSGAAGERCREQRAEDEAQGDGRERGSEQLGRSLPCEVRRKHHGLQGADREHRADSEQGGGEGDAGGTPGGGSPRGSCATRRVRARGASAPAAAGCGSSTATCWARDFGLANGQQGCGGRASCDQPQHGRGWQHRERYARGRWTNQEGQAVQSSPNTSDSIDRRSRDLCDPPQHRVPRGHAGNVEQRPEDAECDEPAEAEPQRGIHDREQGHRDRAAHVGDDRHAAAADAVHERAADDCGDEAGHRAGRGDDAGGRGIPGAQQHEVGQHEHDRGVAQQRQEVGREERHDRAGHGTSLPATFEP